MVNSTDKSTDRLQRTVKIFTVKIFNVMTMNKFLLNLHSKNAAALSRSSLKGPDNLDSLPSAAEDSRAQSCFHLCEGSAPAQELGSSGKGGGKGARLSAETAF